MPAIRIWHTTPLTAPRQRLAKRGSFSERLRVCGLPMRRASVMEVLRS